MKHLILLSLITLTHYSPIQSIAQKSISKNGMEVNWKYEDDRIHFELASPSSGWLCIGFNDGPSMTGAYLLMGRIVDGKAEVVEHYTESSGNYNPLMEYNAVIAVGDVSGEETREGSRIRFSLPTEALSEYARNLQSGKTYTVTLAYSRSDDFDHHSIMRTSVLEEF